MDFQVVWSAPAVGQLESIVRYVAQDSVSAAENLRVEILERIDVLRTFPYSGAAYERDERGRVREILCRNYRIFYRVFEATERVEILLIWHSSRQEPKLR